MPHIKSRKKRKRSGIYVAIFLGLVALVLIQASSRLYNIKIPTEESDRRPETPLFVINATTESESLQWNHEDKHFDLSCQGSPLTNILVATLTNRIPNTIWEQIETRLSTDITHLEFLTPQALVREIIDNPNIDIALVPGPYIKQVGSRIQARTNLTQMVNKRMNWNAPVHELFTSPFSYDPEQKTAPFLWTVTGIAYNVSKESDSLLDMGDLIDSSDYSENERGLFQSRVAMPEDPQIVIAAMRRYLDTVANKAQTKLNDHISGRDASLFFLHAPATLLTNMPPETSELEALDQSIKLLEKLVVPNKTKEQSLELAVTNGPSHQEAADEVYAKLKALLDDYHAAPLEATTNALVQQQIEFFGEKKITPILQGSNYLSEEELKNALVSERAWASLTLAAPAKMAHRENFDVHFSSPLDGSMIWVEHLAILKPDCPALEQVIDRLTSQNVAAAVSSATFFCNTIEGSLPYISHHAQPNISSQIRQLDVMELDRDLKKDVITGIDFE